MLSYNTRGYSYNFKYMAFTTDTICLFNLLNYWYFYMCHADNGL